MAKWTNAANLEQLPHGETLPVEIDGIKLVLCRQHDNIFAIRNCCPHAGLPLEDAELRDHIITCPFHGYAYNITNGRNIDYPDIEPPVRTYPTRLKDQAIQVDTQNPAKPGHPGQPPTTPNK